MKMRKVMTFVVVAGLGAVSLLAAPQDARADWRGNRGYNGGAVAAGIIGGVAAGALIAGAARPAYGYPAPAYNAPGYGYAPVANVYDEEPVCYWRRQRVWLDPYTTAIRRVRVCE